MVAIDNRLKVIVLTVGGAFFTVRVAGGCLIVCITLGGLRPILDIVVGAAFTVRSIGPNIWEVAAAFAGGIFVVVGVAPRISRQLFDIASVPLASLLLGKSTAAWDDGTHVVFEREFQSAIRKIEEVALNVADVAVDGDKTLIGLVNLADGRIREMVTRIRRLAGDSAATELLETLLKDVKSGNIASGT